MFIVPNPKKMEIKEEKIKLTSFSVNTDSDEIYEFTNDFRNINSDVTADFKFDSQLKEEHYKIDISKEGIFVSYGDIEGAYRAFTTLKQIISQAENNEINCLYVEDYPSIKNRVQS